MALAVPPLGVNLETFPATPDEARELQRRLSAQVDLSPLTGRLRSVCGVDVSGVRGGVAVAAAVVLRFPELSVAEFATAEGPLTFPYRSGLLSFRECPLVLTALERLPAVPDVLMVDGQGYAHPRRLGLASHLGVLLDVPTVGCAKSRLCGDYVPLGLERGSRSDLVDKGEIVGAVVRTRKNVKPLFVSPGHRVDIEDAVRLVLACGRGVRVPAPTGLAHRAAADPAAFVQHINQRGSE